MLINYLKRFYLAMKKGIIIFFIVFMAMSVLSWEPFFDDLKLIDSKIENWIIRIAGEKKQSKKREPFSDKIVLTSIYYDSEEDNDNDRFMRRGKYAELVKRLSEAGARVIMFDMCFEDENKKNPEIDKQFIDAIKQARKRGTAVVVGICSYEKEEIISPEFEKVFGQGQNRGIKRYGMACIGKKAGIPRYAPLSVTKKEKNEETTLYSISLKAIESYEGGEILDVYMGSNIIKIAINDAKKKIYKVPFLEQENLTQPKCSTIHPGDKVCNIALDLSYLDVLDDEIRRYDIDDIIGWERMKPERFMGKIVIVGAETADEQFVMDSHIEKIRMRSQTRADEQFIMGSRIIYYGMEFHALAINTLLNNNVYIKPCSLEVKLSFIFIFSIIGVLIGCIRYTVSDELSGFKRIFSVIMRSGLSVLVLLSCFPKIPFFSISVYLYNEYSIILNMLYCFSAFFIVWMITEMIIFKKS